MKIAMKNMWLFYLILIFTTINFASAASLHGHHHHHSQEETPRMIQVGVKRNATSCNVNILSAETEAASQRQRYPSSLRQQSDPSRLEQSQTSEDEESAETRAWMGGSIEICALGLILGAEMVG
jgi:hypothetical protein